jgi:hypothetical protein
MILFCGEELLAYCPTPKMEDRPLSAVRDCLFNLFSATLHTGGRSSIRNLRTRHAVVTGTHLSRNTPIQGPAYHGTPPIQETHLSRSTPNTGTHFSRKTPNTGTRLSRSTPNTKVTLRQTVLIGNTVGMLERT